MENFELISIWRAPKKKGFYRDFHSHDYHELVYYPFGKGETVIAGKRYVFSNNCFTIIPPHTMHNERHLADSEVICMMVSGSFDSKDIFNYDSTQTIYKILKNLHSEAKTQNYLYKEIISLKLSELNFQLRRMDSTRSDEKNFEFIMNYIKENYHEKLAMTDCAKQLNLSYDYFQHQFKKITGLSPQQYLITTRLSAAEKLLLSGDLSCTEIAFRCGFSTSAQFASIFKKTYGMSPLQFRKQHNQ